MTKILIVGMADSIHTAHWIERIINSDLEIHFFPSRRYRKIHPLLLDLTDRFSNFKLQRAYPTSLIAPYWNYFWDSSTKYFTNRKITHLRKLINSNNYDFIHALELQHAGYLMLDLDFSARENTKLIVTNWGSDIYFFQNSPDHEQKLRRLLKKASRYSAECSRDYELARKLGFKGESLPIIPNSFSNDKTEGKFVLTSDRTQIIAKCYGEVFGLGSLVISAVESMLLENLKYSFFLYSVTSDLEELVVNLAAKFPGRLRFSTVRNSLSHKDLLLEFSKSRVYLGASLSDGISTSFLESMSQGAFPIQTNTSCAADWIKKGCLGIAVNPDLESIIASLRRGINDDELVNKAQALNPLILEQHTNFDNLSKIAKAFYDG
jgi:glycosyltransferase involved in cell wall biosynthesis